MFNCFPSFPAECHMLLAPPVRVRVFTSFRGQVCQGSIPPTPVRMWHKMFFNWQHFPCFYCSLALCNEICRILSLWTIGKRVTSPTGWKRYPPIFLMSMCCFSLWIECFPWNFIIICFPPQQHRRLNTREAKTILIKHLHSATRFCRCGAILMNLLLCKRSRSWFVSQYCFLKPVETNQQTDQIFHNNRTVFCPGSAWPRTYWRSLYTSSISIYILFSLPNAYQHLCNTTQWY